MNLQNEFEFKNAKYNMLNYRICEERRKIQDLVSFLYDENEKNKIEKIEEEIKSRIIKLGIMEDDYRILHNSIGSW